ncbi:MAG: peptidylprolyl isomerase [Candidatus Omnitrophica bacterium]|nr:peptidylprolyl isomerase [Candidatus Omnitrophota bacterium]
MVRSFRFQKKAVYAVFAVSLLGVASGCGGKPAAVVNGQVITQQQVDDRMARLNPAYKRALGGDKRRLLEEMIMETILLQEAKRRGLERDQTVDQLVREARRQILLGRLLEIVREGQKKEVSDEEIAQAYEAGKETFVEPETYRASHILVRTQEEAQKVLDRLKAGESFTKLAEEVSIDPSKARGGDVGYFSKGQLIPEFETAVENLKIGDYSGIVQTQLGYHVIMLTERKIARQLPLDEVKDQIQRQMTSRQQQRAVEEFIQQLRAKAQVQIKDPSFAMPQQPASTPRAQQDAAQPTS